MLNRTLVFWLGMFTVYFWMQPLLLQVYRAAYQVLPHDLVSVACFLAWVATQLLFFCFDSWLARQLLRFPNDFGTEVPQEVTTSASSVRVYC